MNAGCDICSQPHPQTIFINHKPRDFEIKLLGEQGQEQGMDFAIAIKSFFEII
jgi:hypothetical protein